MAQTSAQDTKQKRGWLREMGSWIVSFAVALVIVLIVRAFIFTIISVDGNSMLDTLETGDRLYVSILSAKINGYERGDVVICYYPGADHQCVKRVIGLPGDTVEMRDGVTYVNGEAVEETYLTHLTNRSFAPVEMGEGEYFVMGDNRPISHDSRASDVGAVTDIVGKVRCIIWPLDRLGGID